MLSEGKGEDLSFNSNCFPQEIHRKKISFPLTAI